MLIGWDWCDHLGLGLRLGLLLLLLPEDEDEDEEEDEEEEEEEEAEEDDELLRLLTQGKRTDFLKSQKRTKKKRTRSQKSSSDAAWLPTPSFSSPFAP